MLLRNTLSFLPAQVLGPAAQLLSIIAWTHMANEKVIGVVTLVTAAQDLFVTVALAWWTLFVIRTYREHDAKDSGADLNGASLVIVGFSALIQAALSIGNLLLVVQPESSLALCAVVGLFTALRGVNQYNYSLESVRLRPLDYSIYAMSGPVLGLVLGLGALAVFGPDPIWPLLGYAIGEGVGVIYGLYRGRNEPRSFKGFNRVAREGFTYGAPLVLAGAAMWASLNLSRYIVDATLGLEAAGQFSVGFGLGQRASSVAAMAVTVVALPLAVKRAQEQGRDAALVQLAQNVALLVAVMAPALVGLWLVSPDLIKLAIGEAYWESTLALLPWSLLAGGLAAFTSHYLHHVFLLDRQTWRALGVDVATAALTAVLALWLTPAMGLVGAVLAIVGAQGVHCLGLLVYLSLRRGLILPWKHFAYTAIATALMAAAVVATPDHHGPLSLVAKIVVGMIVYASATAFFYRDWVAGKLRARRTQETAA